MNALPSEIAELNLEDLSSASEPCVTLGRKGRDVFLMIADAEEGEPSARMYAVMVDGEIKMETDDVARAVAAFVVEEAVKREEV